MKFSVQKYDPTRDAEPKYVDYEVPAEEYMTVLQALQYINENIEPVAFDFSCRGRNCGRCAMTVNGKACLACVTAVKEGADYTVEPLDGYPVVHDLIVDKSVFHAQLRNDYKRIRYPELTTEEVNKPIDYETAYTNVHALEYCARCGVCMASCPVLNNGSDGQNKYVGPARMMAVAFRHYDPYDQADRILEAVQKGLFNCIMCGTCDEVCRALEIHHVDIYKELRDAAAERGFTA